MDVDMDLGINFVEEIEKNVGSFVNQPFANLPAAAIEPRNAGEKTI